MKFACLLILAATLVFAACSPPETSNHNPVTADATPERPDTPPILEISEDAQGAWSVVGQSLVFRVYENGTAEFDYPEEPKNRENGPVDIKDVASTIRYRMADDDLNKLKDLLNSSDLAAAKDRYRNKCCCTDATTSYKVDFRSGIAYKHIDLEFYCGLNMITNPGKYRISDVPKPITDLMLMIYYQREKIYYRRTHREI